MSEQALPTQTAPHMDPLALEREIEMAPIASMLTAAEIVERSREEKVTH